MALAGFQRALAVLYVDARARDAFEADPAGYARRYGLDDDESGRLTSLGSAHVRDYARTLARKRRNEIARLASRTASALGDTFASTAERYFAVSRDGAAAGRRPVADARSFVAFVAHDVTIASNVRDIAREEKRLL